MTTASLTNVPAEVLVHIFESADNFKTVSRLSKTCRHFHEVWEAHISSICEIVLSRTIEYYDELVRLDDAWWKSYSKTLMKDMSSAHFKKDTDHPMVDDRAFREISLAKRPLNSAEAIIHRTKRFLSEASTANRSVVTVKRWYSETSHHPGAFWDLKPFCLRAWYLALTLIVSSCTEAQHSLLETAIDFDLDEVYCICSTFRDEFMPDSSFYFNWRQGMSGRERSRRAKVAADTVMEHPWGEEEQYADW